ncbi:MAG: S8 family serine peptidase, partial [Oscillospiraceae bacterium]|nr:S8 family serine peptidase [Oscillospiraceae bacterium]
MARRTVTLLLTFALLIGVVPFRLQADDFYATLSNSDDIHIEEEADLVADDETPEDVEDDLTDDNKDAPSPETGEGDSDGIDENDAQELDLGPPSESTFGEDKAGGGSNGGAERPEEAPFAEGRVIIKLANRSSESRVRMQGTTPDLGVAYTEIHLLNPSMENDGTMLFQDSNGAGVRNNVYVLTLLESGVDAVLDAIEILAANPAVEYAEPDYLYRLDAKPNDPRYNAQHALDMIDAERAWEITRGSKEVVVGIIDTGIDGKHPDLKDNLWVNPNPNKNGFTNDIHGYDFSIKSGGIPYDMNGHGTHVAGIVGARGNNGIGISGVNWQVSLAWLGAYYGGGYILNSAVVEALNYANNHGISITNNSYGGYVKSLFLEEAIKNYNGLFIAAAGNDSTDNDIRPLYPASYGLPNIISVSSVDSYFDTPSPFTNYGSQSVHIAAPGKDVLSTFPGGIYREESGTSMAAPHVAGVAALVKSLNPEFTTAQLRAALLDTARKVVIPYFQAVYGSGIVNAHMAVLGANALHSVVFDFNDGVRSPITVKVAPSERLKAPMFKPQRSGWTFTGWHTEASGGALFDFSGEITRSFTLYAGWEMTPVTAAPVTGVLYPVAGRRPSLSIDDGKGYTASLAWENSPEVFEPGAVYTCVITLRAQEGFILSGFDSTASISGFTVNSTAPSELVSNDDFTLVFKVTFPGAAEPEAIVSAPVTGVISPVALNVPSDAINDGAGYTSLLSWDRDPVIFEVGESYTATITLTAKNGFIFGGFDSTESISGFTVNGIAPVLIS